MTTTVYNNPALSPEVWTAPSNGVITVIYQQGGAGGSDNLGTGGGGGGGKGIIKDYPVTEGDEFTIAVPTGGAVGESSGADGYVWKGDTEVILFTEGVNNQAESSGVPGSVEVVDVPLDSSFNGGYGDPGSNLYLGGGGSGAGNNSNGTDGTGSVGGTAPSGGGNGGNSEGNALELGGGGGSLGTGANGEIIIIFQEPIYFNGSGTITFG